MLTGKKPFDSPNRENLKQHQKEIMNKIISNDLEWPKFVEVSKNAKDLIQKLMHL